ncbi:MAG: sodium:proton antiporter [Oceanospirillales bacterium LUC14_002_19_P2]|nr:MAG: sodium:proton antiporter [Oceanospirillales bacterium LUC14_002_19_P2]
MNAVIVAVVIMLSLSLMRVNVILALFLGALAGGLTGGLNLDETLSAFGAGLGGGASIALSYALLGAFAMAISRSGIPEALAGGIITQMDKAKEKGNPRLIKLGLLGSIILMAIASQNLIPVHIAFIPILIPPLLSAFSRMQMDRRQVACVITFGLTATYMLFPVGFGNIYLNEILAANLKTNGLDTTGFSMSSAMIIPVVGMFLGMLTAVFITYRKPRTYRIDKKATSSDQAEPKVSRKNALITGLAVALALTAQLQTGSMSLGALVGCITLVIGGVICWRSADDVFVQGMKMMAFCGFIMITAAGFSEVLRTTGAVPQLVSAIGEMIQGNKGLAAFMMLLVGLLVTMGIGSSFSTVPIIATLYVPLGLSLGFSPLAVAALVGTSGALGDAGSPASDSTIGPTAGLNADGQHDHIRDSVIPTFIHYNLQLLAFGWVAAMIL